MDRDTLIHAAYKCADPSHDLPPFDKEAARGLSSDVIRERWPRKCVERCPSCGWHGVIYASLEHYIMGDY